MADLYMTKDGDMIDEICWRHYPNRHQNIAVELVYEANNRLADIGAILPAGLTILLPDLPNPSPVTIVNIWG